MKHKTRNLFRRRAAIAPVIGSLKSDFSMSGNFLKGIQEDKKNALMAGAAFNFRRILRKIEKSILG